MTTGAEEVLVESGDMARLKELAGDLIDGLHDELRYEVNENLHVLRLVQQLCAALHPTYYRSYVEEGWL